MAWPPPILCLRFALLVFGASLMIYLVLSGLLLALGFDIRVAVIGGQFLALFGFSLWLAWLMRIPLAQAFSLRPAARQHWIMVFAAAIPLQVAGGALQFAVLGALPEDSAMRRIMQQTLPEFVAVETTFDLLTLFAAAVLTAAICEEFLFRGLILGLLRRRGGWTSAIVWSGVLFAIFHLNLVVLPAVALVGMYLAVLVARSGSIYPAIVAHALNNGLALSDLPLLVSEAAYERHLWLTLPLSSGVFLALLRVYLRATRSAAATPLSNQPPSPPEPSVLDGIQIDGEFGVPQQALQGQQAEQAEQGGRTERTGQAEPGGAAPGGQTEPGGQAE